MSSKQNLTLHLNGIVACESMEFDHALQLFKRITEPSAPIYFNMGHCYLKLSRFDEALEMFQQCVARDKYLAIGHFKLAVAQTLLGDLVSAANSFQDAFSALRGNSFIDYKQLNMPCKLYASEIDFNLGLVYLFYGDYDTARECFHAAGGLPTDSSRHSVIPEAIDASERERWEYFGQDAAKRLIMLPDNSFFRVSKAKMEGLQTSTKFMDEAKVVAAAKDEYSFVGFVGANKLNSGNNPSPTSQSTKRNNPPVGPPPSVPPPRLPSSVSQPPRTVSASIPSKSREMSPGRMSPTRKSSPSRPPPPSTIPPKTASKSPTKTPQGRRPHVSGSNVISELRKTMENVNLKKADVSPRPAANNDIRGSAPAPVPKSQTQKTTLKCEFKLDVNADTSYDELLVKLSEKLYQAASDLNSPLQRESLILSLEDQTKKTKVAITSENASWRTLWSSMTKNRLSEPLLMLKESEKEAQGRNSRQGISPPSPSPGYRPSRPVPSLNNKGQEIDESDEEWEEDIYHDIS